MKKDIVNINDIVTIMQEAHNKSFSNKELGVVKTVYDLAMSEYVAHTPYSVYRDNAAHDKMYFSAQKDYAATKAREYITKTIDQWQRKQ